VLSKNDIFTNAVLILTIPDIMVKPEILIVGAGPTGLMMACQLAVHNIPFRIIDKNEDHTTQSRALVIHARSLEIFEQMGIAEEAVQLGKQAKAVNLFINGKRRMRINLNNAGTGLTQFPFLLILEQSKTEKLLNEFINKRGYYVERNTELIDFLQNNDSVQAAIKHIEKGQEDLQISWLIGADGAGSIVRNKLEIPFAGKTYKESLFVLDCEMTMNLPADEMCICFSAKTFAGLFPMTNGRTRVIGIVPEEFQDNETITFEEVNKDFANLTRLHITLKNPHWISKYHSHHRAVSNFRKGRCFLAGDAAHIHSPVGAQGMNTGLQDAYNLAWKLALVIKESAKESLLDTYNEERIVIAQKLVKSTDRVFHIVTSKKKIIQFFRLYFMPALMRLILPVVQRIAFIRRKAFKGISEIGLHYRYGKLADEINKPLFSNKAPKPGDRVPYLPTIQSLLSGDKFHLLIFGGKVSDANVNWAVKDFTDKYNFLITAHDISFTEASKNIYQRFGITQQGYYLIRPDNYIACRSNTLEIQKVINYFEVNILSLQEK
jgi:2-polyprenyl-6-methoxyphenol hydroxylase-like FAD-dependent oxidoreductase